MKREIRARERVTMSLNTSNSNLLVATNMASSGSYEDENAILQQEINKLEDMLANARAERDEILIRYNALSERVRELLYLCSR